MVVLTLLVPCMKSMIVGKSAAKNMIAIRTPISIAGLVVSIFVTFDLIWPLYHVFDESENSCSNDNQRNQ